LKTGSDPQAKKVAEIIQRVRPDVLLINEFDFDESELAAQLFQDLYLAQPQHGCEPIRFDYRFTGPVNTGVPTGLDLNRDGDANGPNDAYGFGRFPGQYGMLVLSRWPIDRESVRTFLNFLWKDMPQARFPRLESGAPYFADEALSKLRLSSKSHWDVPIRVGDSTIHFLVAHPTPPAFDGPEMRNRLRNHDEVRLFADYVDPSRSEYLYDDKGVKGGLSAGARFVIAGDMNADPVDGQSIDFAAKQLTEHPLINTSPVPASQGAVAATKAQLDHNSSHKSDPASDTSNFSFRGGPGNLRVDYVLPSKTLSIVASGVFWPLEGEPGADLVEASDHRMVWVDLK
jgi:endonuclease/exonuclease/phosphatase family metal-dependent hydrolase